MAGKDPFSIKVEMTNNKYYDSEKQFLQNYAKKSADNKVMQDMGIRYAKALEKFGMNVENPIIANAIYYNRSNFNISDPPQAARTFVFITRPDCNFARANIRANPYLDNLYELPMGKILFPMLTHPHHMINHEFSTDDFSKQETLLSELNKALKAAQESDSVENSDDGGDISQVSDFNVYKNASNKTKIDELLNQLWNEHFSTWNTPDNSENSTQQMDNDFGNPETFDFRMNTPPIELTNKAVQMGNAMPIRYSRDHSLNNPAESFDTVVYNTPFIPLLMNNCLEVSSGKDFIIASRETEGDYYGGRLSYPTGAGEMFASGEISLTFRDNYYSMIYNLFWTWITYIDGVSRGELLPRISNIWEKVLDYTCSIYIFVCDKDFSTLRGWAKYTGCRPTSISTAGIIHSSKGDVNSNWEQFQVPFVYNHVEYMTPEIFTDFNYVAGTEYDRRLKKSFHGYSLYNSGQSYSADQLFDQVTIDGSSGIKLGVSGQAPERALKINSEGQLTTKAMDKTDENANLNKMMPPYQRISLNDTWDGFPIIINNRLVWKHVTRHKTASSIYGTTDETYDQSLEEALDNKTAAHVIDSDPEGAESSTANKTDTVQQVYNAKGRATE